MSKNYRTPCCYLFSPKPNTVHSDFVFSQPNHHHSIVYTATSSCIFLLSWSHITTKPFSFSLLPTEQGTTHCHLPCLFPQAADQLQSSSSPKQHTAIFVSPSWAQASISSPQNHSYKQRINPCMSHHCNPHPISFPSIQISSTCTVIQAFLGEGMKWAVGELVAAMKGRR